MKYVPPGNYAADFLHTCHVWWTISISKQNLKTRSSLENAAALKDGNACSIKSHLAEQFQAALVEELFEENYNFFLLTPRFQSDAPETRFRLYRQISGARFLVFAK